MKSLFKYIAIIFVINLWVCSDSSAFETCQTSEGLDIKWDTFNAIYYVNTQGAPTGSLSAIQSAMQTWTDVDTAAFTFIYGGSTSSTAHGTNDGINIVTFGPMGKNGTLAENAFWYSVSAGYILDSDIKFNTSYTWAVDGSANAYDVQNVGTHEHGHSLCLADLYDTTDSAKTMYGYVSHGETEKRTLDPDDIEGINYLYPLLIVQCNLIPDTTVIHRGGTLGFQATATNNTNNSASVLFATKVTKPNGYWYPSSGFLIGPNSHPFGPYQTKSFYKSHYIPLTAPLGIYTYHAYVGNYGPGNYSECQFNFEVIDYHQNCTACHQ